MTLPLFQEYRTIQLTNGMTAKVDADDFLALNELTWQAFRATHSRNWYAVRNYGTKPNQKTVRMHRQIMGVTDPKVFIDHINGDSLDNRRCNLRIVTHSQNHMNERLRSDNASGFKGITRVTTKSERWQANITANGKTLYLGCFKTKEEAYAARRAAEQQLHGEYARA